MLGFGPTPSDVWGPSSSKVELINNANKSDEEARAARVEFQESISKMQAEYDNKLENLRANYDNKLENLQQQVAMLMQMQQQNYSGQVIQIKWATRLIEVEDGVVAVLSEFLSPWMGSF
ncbi:uncharacterized protein LOC132286299 [Cornus florida]|uniref:uncharacterized protein LOC132286299 n=1 Tax=Cornus florida TaxID=4283 RepID=UPI0028A0ECAD|nr:uncharacterized protein LOC132286299 [Cornus florida]